MLGCVEIEDIDFLVDYYVFLKIFFLHLHIIYFPMPYFYRFYEIDQENYLCWDFLGEKKNDGSKSLSERDPLTSFCMHDKSS